MKISELVRKTKVPKETIHYYVREGLIPRPRKSGKNVANYTKVHVEQIQLIKQIQDNFYLPLSLIKKIVKQLKDSPELRSLLKLRSDYQNPMNQLLETEAVGEEAFQKVAGLGPKWLQRFEEWGVITPDRRGEKKIYSQDDVIIGKLLVDLDRAGFGPKDGFDPEHIKRYVDLFREIVVMAHTSYLQTNLEKFTPDQNLERVIKGRELMSLFFYHLYRKLLRDETDRFQSIMEDKDG
ncbi:MAG: MerR family transcriptional regulator [Deltaproteobacteria bacterium]|nr:MerR family transcriptional regulator [Deltaproteobacteria bacterium]